MENFNYEYFYIAINYILDKNLVKNKSELSKILNLKPSTFSEILKKRMQPNILLYRILIEKFNFNSFWLITGEGEMLRKDESPQQPVLGTSQPIEQSHNCEHLEKVINNLEKTIEIQQQQIDNLLRLVEILQRQQDFKPSKTKRD